MIQHRLLGIALLMVFAAPSTAYAADTIQERRFAPLHSVALGVGLMPLDPYTKGITGSLAYTLHVSDHLAWRAVELGVSQGLKTNLRRDLEDNFGKGGYPFMEPQVLVTTQLVWSPLYGRESFINRSAVWSSVGVSVGVGTVRINRGAKGEFSPAGSAGLCFELYLNDDFTMRLDAKDVIVFESFGLPNNVIWLSMALQWTLERR